MYNRFRNKFSAIAGNIFPRERVYEVKIQIQGIIIVEFSYVDPLHACNNAKRSM